MSNNRFQLVFLHPKYWGISLGFILLRLLAYLPYSWKIRIGEFLGKVLFKLVKSRRELARKNIRLAFPHFSEAKVNEILQQHFQSLGVSLLEIGITAWGRHQTSETNNETKYFSYSGLEHLENHTHQGTLILVPHFTSVEMTGLMLSFVTEFQPIYRPHDNPYLEYLITKFRSLTPSPNQVRKKVSPLANTQPHAMVKALRQGKTLWIAPDQKYGGQGFIEVPFFGYKTPSNPGINRLAKMGRARVVPCFTYRNGLNYHMEFLPALENFPSGNDYQDTLRLHKLYEAKIQQNPSQYLWVHDRWDIKNKNPHLPLEIFSE